MRRAPHQPSVRGAHGVAGRRRPPGIRDDVAKVVRDSRLRYVGDRAPGIRRRKRGGKFAYVRPGGKPITDPAVIGRINQLAIPPAWTDVWICPQENGHIQAIGRDVRGRKQYRYHEDWVTARDATKYERMIAFARVLPRIRRIVSRDVARRGLNRAKAIATMVQLLQRTLIRVGNEEYARQNKSYGLSTLQDRHVQVGRKRVRFSFTGKSGKKHQIDLHDARLARIVGQLQDLPGQELFQYVDGEGKRQSIASDDVNDYIRRAAKADYTAKDFRTWSGTVLAALYLAACAGTGQRATKKNLRAAIDNVASVLGNTPAVCRKAYIHPAVMDGFLRGEVIAAVQREPAVVPVASAGLSAEEKATLEFLERKARSPKRNLRELLKSSLRGKLKSERPSGASRKRGRRRAPARRSAGGRAVRS